MTDIKINPDEIYWAFWRKKDAYNYGNGVFLMEVNMSSDLKRVSVTVEYFKTKGRGAQRRICSSLILIRTSSWIISEHPDKTKKDFMVLAVQNLIEDAPSTFIHPIISSK